MRPIVRVFAAVFGREERRKLDKWYYPFFFCNLSCFFFHAPAEFPAAAAAAATPLPFSCCFFSSSPRVSEASSGG